MDKEKFQKIKNKYEFWSSWAVWATQDGPDKSNVGNLDIFNLNKNPKILDILNPDVIFVGLNISRQVEHPFANFHDSSTKSQDFKLRYAVKDTPAWGGYMTDIIKGYEEVESVKLKSYLKNNVDFEKENINLFSKELSDIGSENPILIALGGDAYKILKVSFKNDYDIIKMRHYSDYLGKETYRSLFIDCIKDHL